MRDFHSLVEVHVLHALVEVQGLLALDGHGVHTLVEVHLLDQHCFGDDDLDLDCVEADQLPDATPSRPPSPPSGPMTRARVKTLQQKVNSLLATHDLATPLDGLLPHAGALYVIIWKPQELCHRDPRSVQGKGEGMAEAAGAELDRNFRP